MKHPRRIILSVLMVCLFTGMTLYAQTGMGRIQGTVRDSTGAVVPNAAVQITQTATGIVTRVVTNAAGFYTSPPVNIGNYAVSVEAPGFSKWQGNLILRTAQIAVVDAKLTVGAAQQRVVVSGDAAQIVNTTNGTIGTTLDQKRIQNLPENGRALQNLVLLTTPGLVSGESGIRANGNNASAFEFVQDGAILANRDFGGTNDRLPDPDAIQEVEVVTSNASAKYDRPSEAILTTKSGTNALHGSLFETNRDNSYGLARARQDTYTKPPQLIRNEFGGTVGGPVYIPHLYNGKQKTFFFFAFEGLELRQGVTHLFSVPTAAMRQGNFSGLTDSSQRPITLYDPLTTTGPEATRQPFLNNQIPISRLSPLAKTMWGLTPLPTLTDVNPAVAANWGGVAPNNDSEKTWTMRFDEHFSPSDSVYFRFSHGTKFPYRLGSGNFGPPTTNLSANVSYEPVKTMSGALSWTHIFSPTFFMQTVLSNNYESDKVQTGPNPNVNYASQLGLPNNFNETGFPNIFGVGFLPLGWGQADTTRENSQNITALDEDMTLVRGRNLLQFGGRYRHGRIWILPDQQPPASTVRFDSLATALLDPSTGGAEQPYNLTGSSAASFFLGNAASYTAQLNPSWYHFRNQEIGMYFQDDFKATPRLTLNAGVRWEIHPAFHEHDGLFGGFDFANKAIVTGVPLSKLYALGRTTPQIVSNYTNVGATFETPSQAGLPASLVKGNYFDFGPRLGIAYVLFDGPHMTVLRGGYGTYIYAPPVRNFYAETRFNPPYDLGFTRSYTNAAQSPDGHPNYLLRSVPTVVAGQNSSGVVDSTSSTLVTPGSFGVSTLDPHYPSSFVHEWNATLEQSLWANTSLRITYNGDHGTNLTQYWSINDAASDYVWYVTTGEPLPTGKYANTARQPFDQTTYGYIETQKKTGWSNDNSLQVEVERMQAKGLGFQFFYVLSNAFRAGGNGWRDSYWEPASYFAPGAVPTDPNASNRFQNYFRDTAIPHHQIRWNWIYELPVGQGKSFLGRSNHLLNALVGGWELASTGEMHSQYWSPTTRYYQPKTMHVYGKKYKIQDCRSGKCFAGYLYYNGYIDANLINKPNGVEGVPSGYVPFNTPLIPRPANGGSPSDPNYRYYDTNSVLVPLKNGTTVRTNYNPDINPVDKIFILGPFNWTMDASVIKSFHLGEHVALRFNADFFNVLNEAGLTNPNSTSGIASLRTSYNAPRQLQLGLHLAF